MLSGRLNSTAVTSFTLILAALFVCIPLTLGGCGNTAVKDSVEEAAEKRQDRSLEFLAGRDAPVYTYEVIRSYDHDIGNFTEGLVLDGGVLFEGTGLNGRSKLIKTDFQTWEVLGTVALAPEYFGEGVTVMSDEVFQLTYTTNLGFVYDRESLRQTRTFSYPTQGWGLTHDGTSLIMSDGSDTLHFMDPASGTETGRVSVYDNLGPVVNLNELEYIEGVVYANVWKTDLIVIIDPTSGEVTGWIDLAGLRPDTADPTGENVLNGIAFDARTGHLLVTGKSWPHIYEIGISP
ncbi:MAG: glutaminyl-peptide cyclotransferase [Actinomycetota bacterium]